MNYYEVFNIAMQVLDNYNDADPYVNIARYAAHSAQIQPNGEMAEHGIITGRHSCNECEEDIRFECEDNDDTYTYEECDNCGHENEIYIDDYR